jgi:dTDP-glucose 4,6-dehydratase
MRFLVTGGAGFIGSNYVRHVLEETDAEVTTVDALTYAGSRENVSDVESPRHTFLEGDVRDRDLVSDLVAEADVVVNFAAESHVDRSLDGAESFVSTNVAGTCALLDAAVDTDLERFIQISTDEVYGETLDGEFTEDGRLDPRNPYAATKAGADLLARSYHVTHDVPVVVTRSSNNFGPRQHPEKLVPKLIQRAADGGLSPSTGTARTSANGRTSRTTVERSRSCANAVKPEKYTTSGVATNGRPSKWLECSPTPSPSPRTTSNSSRTVPDTTSDTRWTVRK